MRAKPRRPAAIVPRLDSVSALDRPITEDPAGCPNRPTILFVAGDPDTTCWTGETGDGLRAEVRGFRNFELRIAPFSANGPGGPSAKTTACTGPPGKRFLTTKLPRAPIAGMRTDWPAFPIVTNISASPSPSGTDEIPF